MRLQFGKDTRESLLNSITLLIRRLLCGGLGTGRRTTRPRIRGTIRPSGKTFCPSRAPACFRIPTQADLFGAFSLAWSIEGLKGAVCCAGVARGECQQLGVVPSVPGDAAARPVLRRPAAPRRAVHLLRRADAGRRADEHGDVGDVCRAAGDRGRLAAHPGTVRRHPAQRGELHRRPPMPLPKL